MNLVSVDLLALDVSIRLHLSTLVQGCFVFHCLSNPTNFFEKNVKAFPNIVSIIMLFFAVCVFNQFCLEY